MRFQFPASFLRMLSIILICLTLCSCGNSTAAESTPADPVSSAENEDEAASAVEDAHYLTRSVLGIIPP